jgi:hypothetical protein
MIEILKEPASYCLRERLTRETTEMKRIIENGMK